MNNIITSELVVAYSQCPLKAYLLLFSENKGTLHDYNIIIEERQRSNRDRYLKEFTDRHIEAKTYSNANFRKSNLLIEAQLKSGQLEAYCDIISNTDSSGDNGKIIYEPTLIIGTFNVSEEHKIELQYVGIVLGKLQHKLPSIGMLIGIDGKSHKVKLESGYTKIKQHIKILDEWIIEKPKGSPSIVLNKHCQSCQFQNNCIPQAKKENSLSLLDRMTPKAIQKYHRKGVFTIYQLSYFYKPRRKKNVKLLNKHNLELQALAIKESKIYIQEIQEIPRNQVEIYLDIEGIPERNFYYLIGLSIHDGDNDEHFSFWAERDIDEEAIFSQMISKTNEYPDSIIYHYGSYELKAISRVAKKYSIDCKEICNRLINLTSYIYGKIYFPTLSNSLKDIGDFLGFSWSHPNASGLQSIAWRYFWEENRNTEYKKMLLAYNQDDCNALKILVNEICEVNKIYKSQKFTASSRYQIDCADNPKQLSTEKAQQVHDQFSIIIKSAHSTYDKNKISLQDIKNQENSQDRIKKQATPRQTRRKVIPKANKIIKADSLTICPIHLKSLTKTKDIAEKTIIDLVFEKDGVRKVVVKYQGFKNYCLKCDRYYAPPLISNFGKQQIYGHGFQVWVVYQRIALRVAYRTIATAIEDQFNEIINADTVIAFIKYTARRYSEVEKNIVTSLLRSPFIHADETLIKIKGIDWYVWTFTDGKYVVYKLTETREVKIVSETLDRYTGVLISDFYCGYDPLEYKQQKCWVHLIRDLNDDLWNAPYDSEYESFVLAIRNLIIPIFEVVEKHGLKKRYLQKFTASVDIFYSVFIENKIYNSDLAMKYKKRFERYRDSLFVFLQEDGIPWHNNTAENAIRHIAIQRDISGTFHESPTRYYLLLAGIYKTCKFQGKSFLKFLLSEKTSIDEFRQPKNKKNTIPVGNIKR